MLSPPAPATNCNCCGDLVFSPATDSVNGGWQMSFSQAIEIVGRSSSQLINKGCYGLRGRASNERGDKGHTWLPGVSLYFACLLVLPAVLHTNNNYYDNNNAYTARNAVG